MFWKAILITTFAIGALARYQITEDQRDQYSNTIQYNTLMQYCKKNGAEDKADEVKTAVTNFKECMEGIFDANTLKKEIKEAESNGAFDEVFKKYCAKSPQLKTCVHTATTGVSPCLDSTIRDNIGLANNASDQLIDFVCYQDGARIARFIAEDGPVCIQEKFNTIRECTTLRQAINSEYDGKKLTIDEQCAKYDEFTTCIVKVLEECSTPTSGNMAETVSQYMRYNNPCPAPKKD